MKKPKHKKATEAEIIEFEKAIDREIEKALQDKTYEKEGKAA